MGIQSESAEVCSGEIRNNASSTAPLIFEESPVKICLGKQLRGSWDDCKIEVNETSSTGGFSSFIILFLGASVLAAIFSKKKASPEVANMSKSELAKVDSSNIQESVGTSVSNKKYIKNWVWWCIGLTGFLLICANQFYKSELTSKSVKVINWMKPTRAFFLMDYDSFKCPENSKIVKINAKALATDVEMVCRFDNSSDRLIVGGMKLKDGKGQLIFTAAMYTQTIPDLTCTEEIMAKLYSLDRSKITDKAYPNMLVFAKGEGKFEITGISGQLATSYFCEKNSNIFTETSVITDLKYK
jgi:hypothetical protein